MEQLTQIPMFADCHAEVLEKYPALDGRRLIHEIIRRMINNTIIDLVETSQQILDEQAPDSIHAVRAHHSPLIAFSEQARSDNQALKTFLRQQLYSHYRVHRMTSKARRILESLFQAFMNDPRLLNPEHQQHVKVLEVQQGETGRARAVADYIAGMTDRYAITEYRRIFDPEELT